MSIARRLSLLVFSATLLAPAGAAFADEPAAAKASPPAETAQPAPTDETTAPTPAEPVPAVPAAPPVMPTTVVRPSGVEAATGTAANTVPPPTTKPSTTTQRPAASDRFAAVEVGRQPSRWHGHPISLSLRDAPLPEVLRSFAKIAGVNLVLAPGITGNVTVELQDVPWDQALWVILKTHGLAAEIDGRIWTVAPN